MFNPTHTLLSVFVVLSAVISQVKAFIPAQASNSTPPDILPANEQSSASLQWYILDTPGGVSDTISYQFVGAGTNGLSQGALVHFSEIGNMSNQSATDFS